MQPPTSHPRPRRLGRLKRGLAALSSAVLLSGCASESSSAPPRVGDPLPALAVQKLGGDSVTLASYRGAPVLVNLWATWCAPCRAEMPYLESVGQARAAQGLRVLGVSTDHRGAVTQVRSVVEERGVTYAILLDPDARSTDVFGVYGLPATFLADADGVITWMRLGPIEEGDPDFERALDAVAPVSVDAGGER